MSRFLSFWSCSRTVEVGADFVSFAHKFDIIACHLIDFAGLLLTSSAEFDKLTSLIK